MREAYNNLQNPIFRHYFCSPFFFFFLQPRRYAFATTSINDEEGFNVYQCFFKAEHPHHDAVFNVADA